MREIKFRAWDGKKMCYSEDQLSRIFNEQTDWQTIMQYTNLKDKHGKEVYERDVIVVGTTDSRGFSQGWSAEVEFSEKGVRLKDTDLWRYNPEIIEVIGNIYENPELLTGTQK
jgi:YopX protein